MKELMKLDNDPPPPPPLPRTWFSLILLSNINQNCIFIVNMIIVLYVNQKY